MKFDFKLIILSLMFSIKIFANEIEFSTDQNFKITNKQISNFSLPLLHDHETIAQLAIGIKKAVVV